MHVREIPFAAVESDTDTIAFRRRAAHGCRCAPAAAGYDHADAAVLPLPGGRDIHARCRRFLKRAAAAGKLDHASIWIRRQYLSEPADAPQFVCICAHPAAVPPAAAIPSDHCFFALRPSRRCTATAARGGVLPGHGRRRATGGVLDVFPLRDLGFLLVLSRRAMADKELLGMQRRVGMLAASLVGALRREDQSGPTGKGTAVDLYRTFVEASTAMTAVIDANGTIALANRRLGGRLGYAREEMECGKKIGELMPGGGWEGMIAPEGFPGVRSASAPHICGLLAKDGEFVDVLVEVAPIPGTSLTVASFLDITELKRLEAQLREACQREVIGSVAAGITHDLNNLLMPMILHCELAMLALDGDNAARYHLEEIVKVCGRVRDQITQIFAVAGKQEERPFPHEDD
jgi:PAS domain S-box-containing protein